MLHVNRLNGLTIAVSENKYLAQIAKRTVLSDDALSVLVPILEEIVGMDAGGISRAVQSRGLVLRSGTRCRRIFRRSGRRTRPAARWREPGASSCLIWSGGWRRHLRGLVFLQANHDAAPGSGDRRPGVGRPTEC